MQAYDYRVPTRLISGKGAVEKLPEIIKGFGKKVLLAYGGGSVKRIGLYDQVKALLSDYEVFELSGIEPNPKIESVRKGAEICRKEGIDFIIALGGGSVIDAVKAISASAAYEGDAWDVVQNAGLITKVIPFFTVLTLAATGSEYDSAAVISNTATNEKLFLGHPDLFPVASVLDATYTFSVPANQTAAGAADILSHTFEQYFVTEGSIITDSMCEGMLKTVIECTPRALENPQDYDARAQLMTASSLGCCGILALGRGISVWPCHGIEHEISAFHDITHGVGLAIIIPHWMRYSLNETTAPRFAQYGVNVFGLDRSAPAMETAKKAIELTEQFFRRIGIPAKLSEVGVTDEHFEEMADHLISHWWSLEGAFAPIDRDGILSILRASL